MKNKTEQVHARVEPFVQIQIKAIAARDGLDVSDIVRRALRELIKRDAPEKRDEG